MEGDASGEASESDEELLPEAASSFLLDGEADALAATKEGEAVLLSVLLLLRVRLSLAAGVPVLKLSTSACLSNSIC